MPEDIEYPEGVDLYDFEDHNTHRKLIFDGLKGEMTKAFPQTYNGVRVELKDVDYSDHDDVDYAGQKKALLQNEYLTKKLRGTVRLYDDENGDLLDEKNVTLMRVPYLTERGTFIHGGNEYASVSQSRLLPGAYTRRQKNGQLTTQFNVRSGSGSAFHVDFEPESSQYRMRVHGANLHLYSLLKDLGIPDSHLEKSWGKEILDANRLKYDSRVLDKAYNRMVAKWDLNPDATNTDKAKAVRDSLESAQIHERVARRNLPNMFDMAKVAEWKSAVKKAEEKSEEPKILSEDMWLFKQAMLGTDDIRAIAKFLNTEHNAGINMDALRDELEQEIMNFVEGDGGVNPAVLAAGVEGLKNVQETMKEALHNPDEIRHLARIPEFEKLARYGAGVLFKMPNGKYLLQENQEGDTDDPDKVGKLRPAGGGKHKNDLNLRATILREINEEFGITKDESSEKISLLGYNMVKGPFRDCAMFQMEDHGLKPGWYQASNSKDEKIKLVEADLDDPRYIGPKLTQLRRYALRGYRGRGLKTASEQEDRAVTEYELLGYAESAEEGRRRSMEIDDKTFGTQTDEDE